MIWHCQRENYIGYEINQIFIFLSVKMLKRDSLDDIQKALIHFFKKNTYQENITLREIASAIWVTHPQTILNKLNQLVLKWYFTKDAWWYKLIREETENQWNDIIQLPIYGFAQCGNKWKRVIDEYSQERIPVTMWMLGMKDISNCFFVRAKWNSMEPKIQDGDLVLIKQQEAYDPNDYVFVVHNSLPKLKKIQKKEDKLYLESINRFFDKVEISKYDETEIVGVVRKIIKNI